LRIAPTASIDCRVWEPQETQTFMIVVGDNGYTEGYSRTWTRKTYNLSGRHILVGVHHFIMQ